MAHIPGLNYAQPKTKSKTSKADGRQCQVIDASHSRCVVSFTLKGTTQRAVLPLDRLYSDQGPCGHQRPPTVGEKLLCDMTPVENTAVNAQWLVAFAWRGKLDSAPKSGPLSGVTGMLSEVGPDSGVLLFVTTTGCRERCAFGRAAVQPDGAPLPVAEPLSRHMDVGETVLFDCRPTTTATNCRWLADKVWFSATPDGEPGSNDSFYEEEEEEVDPPEERGGFILRVTLKSLIGRVDLVQNYKAVLTFDHAGQRHRALLVTAKYTFPEKASAAERRDLTKVLSRGDQVQFTCHEYDKPNGTDRCGWWVMEAVKLETGPAVGREAGYFQSGHLYEKIGTVKDVLAAEGLLHFVLDGRREVAWFSIREVFINGRPCDGLLCDALEAGQRVHFNAERSPAPRGAGWRCICVWRGEMPTVEASQKRIEAAVGKKQKKVKSGKSRIDDLDDFELPAAPASAGGDGWMAAAATFHVHQASPHHTPRPNLGGGDRGGRNGRPPQRLRASMADAMDDDDTGSGGGSVGLSGDGGLNWADEGGVDWAEDSGAGWDEEPGLGDPAGPEPTPGSTSSGPSRPLSDASLEHALGSPRLSPSRTAAARRSPVGRRSPSDPGRPSLVPPQDPNPARPPPGLATPRQPAGPSNSPRQPAGQSNSPRQPAGQSNSPRQPAGPFNPPRQPAGPANPPGMSPAALAAAAAATYSKQQAVASLLGPMPPPHTGGLLPTPLVPAFYGYPPPPPPFWQPGMADPRLAAHLRLMYGVGLAPPPPPPPPPPPVIPPLNVNHGSLDRMAKGGRPPVSATSTRPVRQPRSVPTADREAVSAAFKTDPAPTPAAPVQSGESSPTLESLERRETPETAVDSLSARLADTGLRNDLPEGGNENGLDEMLAELETDAGPLGEAEDGSPPPQVEPLSGRGQILAFVDESQGLAEWSRDGHIEKVVFDRDVCFWMGERMDTLDLTDCYTPGAEVLFQCVPAQPDDPYQWVATHFEQVED